MAAQQIKNLGIQEAKMLQLPTACQLQNASLSFCPNLWLEKHPATPAASTGSGTSQPDKSGDSGRIKQRPALAGLLMIVAAHLRVCFPCWVCLYVPGFHPILFAVVVILSSTLISAMVVVKAIIYDLRVLISGF
ncbi:hypothetical protein OIU74_013381 [Salix koriyanagi]|uniref:Uncharacterized protein n=1 Tax=Salix koriyanagi TaxID=2511006 RepID=A0A9Q0Q901_9ROSI|nr:hypothetical protein OIU74_013381 [Salix koriyanagi]